MRWLYAVRVALLQAVVWLWKWRGEEGEEDALWVDARQAEHLETRTLTDVKPGRVIYLVGGRGNTGSIFLLIENWCSQTLYNASDGVFFVTKATYPTQDAVMQLGWLVGGKETQQCNRKCAHGFIYCACTHRIRYFIFMSYSSCFLMETFLTVSSVKTQQGTKQCSGKAHILVFREISSSKNHISDTNGWKIQVKSRADVNLYAHNLQNLLYFHFYISLGGNPLNTEANT